MSVFLNKHDQLRSGWRFAVYVAVFVVFLFAGGAALSLLFAEAAFVQTEAGFLALNALSLLIPAVLSLIFMARVVDHVPVAVFGATLHEGWARDFGIGCGIAAAMLGIYIGGAAAFGSLNMEPAPALGDEGYGIQVALLVSILLVSAANEEIIFRGYPLQVLMLGLGRWPAMVMTSALFGGIHHMNPNATWLGTANTFLAGILLALAYSRTRSLWLPFGVHIGWNLAIGPICGFPVSGITISSVLRSAVDGPAWITGGAYGPEGGVLGTAVMTAAIVLVAATRSVAISPAMRMRLAEHSGTVPGPGAE